MFFFFNLIRKNLEQQSISVDKITKMYHIQSSDHDKQCHNRTKEKRKGMMEPEAFSPFKTGKFKEKNGVKPTQEFNKRHS